MLKSSIILALLFMWQVSALELIKNNSFERLDGKGIAEFWRPNGEKTRKNVKIFIEKKGGPDGQNYAALFTDDPGIQASDFIAWIQDIDLGLFGDSYPAGKEFMLSFDFSGDTPGTEIRGYVEGHVMGKVFNAIGPAKSIYVGWTRYELRFRLPEEKPQTMYVVLQLLKPGTGKIDNVSISEAPPAAATPNASIIEKKSVPSLNIRFPDLPAQSTFIIGKTPRILKVDAKMDENKFSELLCEIQEFDSKRVLAKNRIESYANHACGSWEFPELSAGVYRLSCSAVIDGAICEENIVFRIAREEEVMKWRVQLREDGYMLKNGKPYFPIGVCPGYFNEAALKAYQMAGINLFLRHMNANMSEALAEKYFSSLAKYDLDAIDWVNFTDSAGESSEKMAERLKIVAENAKKYPNFLGWMNDEDAWRGMSASDEQKCYQLFFRYLPGFICWNNQAPRGTLPFLRKYARHTDITGVDVYPIPAAGKHSEMPRQTIACVGDYVDDYMEISGGNKPVWMILQAWSWANTLEGTLDKPVPSYTELRFMFYNAITHGATGIAWFQQPAMDPSSPVMARIAKVNHEFHAIKSFLLEGTKSDKFSLFNDTADLRLLERNLSGKSLLILVNERDKERIASVKSLESCQLFDTLGKKDVLAKAAGDISMAPFEVIIFCTRQISFSAPEQFPALTAEPERTPIDKAVNEDFSGRTLWNSRWFWNERMNERSPYSECRAYHEFDVSGKVSSAWLMAGADNFCEVYLNGKKLFAVEGWSYLKEVNIAPYLKTGKNVLEMKIANYSSFGGAIFEGAVETSNGKTSITPSEESTKITAPGTDQLITPFFFSPAPGAPWGEIRRL